MQQHVLQLYVPIDNALAVTEVHGDDQLLEDPSCRGLVEPPLWLLKFDVLMHRASIGVLKHNGNVPVGEEDLPEMNHVRVSAQAELPVVDNFILQVFIDLSS